MINRKHRFGVALAALAIGLAAPVATAPAAAQSGVARPAETLNLSKGTGTLVRLASPMTDVFIANDTVADVQVRSASQLYIFGKARGETTVYATGKDGRVVYAANIRVGSNIGSIDDMLRLAMPDADIQATPMNNLVLLTGTASSPSDVETAQRLVENYLGNDGTMGVVNRIRTAVPLQVTLKVKIAEVSRSLLKSIGVNLLADTGGKFNIGIAQGQGIFLPPPGNTNPNIVPQILRSPIGSTLSGAGRLFGMDILSSLDLAETDGLVVTLAEPNLTALSGETASFLAGGEFPIPVSQSLGAVAIEYKQYGVSLAFTPIVLADGRISMRVRPEVSELSSEGSIRLNGFDVPALTTRRAETTVELGSGQSFMLAGLLRNTNTNDIDKAPFLGDLPILGSLFRSTQFRRQETELVIIVTPYLVRPVSGRLALPTDGYRAPTDAQRVLMGQSYMGESGQPAYGSPGAPPPPPPVPAPSVGGTAATTASPGFKL